MPVTNVWANEAHTLILVTFESTFSWDEFRQSVDEFVAMVNSVPHGVDGLADVSQTRLPPGNPFPCMRICAAIADGLCHLESPGVA